MNFSEITVIKNEIYYSQDYKIKNNNLYEINTEFYLPSILKINGESLLCTFLLIRNLNDNISYMNYTLYTKNSNAYYMVEIEFSPKIFDKFVKKNKWYDIKDYKKFVTQFLTFLKYIVDDCNYYSRRDSIGEIGSE